ncbi:symmetrical bis(5'-nucleosyl)-tetraphosphatase [Kingella kingae]|uniref:symmetrical bis(5'-nucleosyl)-tetraphosphatase n=1 Tax=Kingella kingae TaxID=504 RepID=UPI000412424A|nr:symmetrical bis(5'-nucleosyl)-tetraphosphatase [Kingella kingae]MDK4530792.1 symmetrical bis(5'-nucleosyl)-tetraphosphatase [Kingella kingae]MDK4574764.1 symmetrical bis(5'-nucleosyl)-tetraphosphatase [Kingella kingae]MDK4580683.1 symmetrical bis(5'-nucleosyl)-tetraphosphatase [Kingella kingae]MDK4596902.1 symmetrical bis(5'-nucleosyl)-tetraphosphatase [Kingella kingae]MDK4600890.1 symmetrical bis(5'-nucleosyl)-tetraphosphatase [Kingella kingae]
MAHYAIGDLQGCYTELSALLDTLQFNHGTDTLWLVGDVVNRGPQSLECLQFCWQHESSVQMVLGNHDLHLLALLYEQGKLKKGDTLDAILQHKHPKKIRDWLRQQPLMRHNDTHVLVHAGLLPEWSVAQAQDLADEVAHEISHQHAKRFFEQMYGNQPEFWSPELHGQDRLRYITNVMTRMRTLNADGSLNHAYKATYASIAPEQHAWFDAPNRQHTSHTIVFGHWSALGLWHQNRVLGLDTGALWGGQLTAANLETGEIIQQESFQDKRF